MMRKLGTKLSSKSSGSQSTSSSLTDSFFSSKSSHVVSSIPIFERQEIPPHTLLELRLACAAIVKETGPSGAELEAILNQADPLEQYKKEEQHRKDIEKIRIHAARTHASAFPPVKGARERDRLSKSNLESLNISSASLVSPQVAPKQSSHRPLIPTAPKQPVEVVELDSQSLQRTLSRKPVPHKEDEKPSRVRAQPEIRHRHTDDHHHHQHHHGRTGASSTSTTRSNTTFDQHISTGQTSFTQTPADNKRRSFQQQLRSSSRNQMARQQRLDDNGSVMSETDFFSPNPDYEVPSLYHAKGVSQGPSRARSRAGSIKDSIIGGIRDYIQPRPSMDRLSRSQSRQSRATTRDSSVAGSRSSSMTRNSKEWMRNAASSLRRKGSLSSLRSSRGGNGDEEDRGRRKDKGPDLNRQLPPLPGLDSYKEPKKHIAQLLAKSKFSKSAPTEDKSRDLLSPVQDANSNPYMASQPAISSQTITSQSKLSPESTSSKQFPRIPFADLPGEERLMSPRQWSSSGHQRQRSQDLLDKSQEDELRRVVREKIMQGGLSRETYDAENAREHENLRRAQTVKQNSWELEQMGAGYIPTTEKKPSHRRRNSVKDSQKKGFRGRFSKFMGHGHGDQNPPITSF